MNRNSFRSIRVKGLLVLALTFMLGMPVSAQINHVNPSAASSMPNSGQPVAQVVTGTYEPQQQSVEPIDYLNASADCSTGPCSVYENGWLTMEGQLQDIDAMWSARFAGSGMEYRSPKAVYFNGDAAVQTGGCGSMDAGAFAFYCSADETLYLNRAALDATFVDAGAYAVTNVLSHEFGHHIQYLTGVEPESVELQANCLVGVYWADADSRGVYEAGFSQKSLDYMGSGSWEDIDPAYGTPGDQQDQWMTGYYDGAGACGLPLQ